MADELDNVEEINDEIVDEVETLDGEEVDTDAEVEAYKPNLTYKVLDEERKFDERLASVIKDKESEDYFRDLYTKADGLDTYKKKYVDLESQAKALVGGFNQIKTLRDSGDIRGVAEALGLDNEALIGYVKGLLEHESLPKEQREASDRLRKLELENQEFKRRMDAHNKSLEDSAVESGIRELEALTAQPEISNLSKAMVKHGVNFVDEVLKEGSFIYQQTGREPSVKSVVDSVAKKYAYLGKTVPTKQPTLPSVRGGNASGIDKPISSIEELRKMSKAMFE